MLMEIWAALMISVVVAVAIPNGATAQTATPEPAAARESGTISPSLGTASDVAMRALDDTPTAPAAGGRSNRILSQNELYNLGRAAEGRVGLRVGTDMSFRVEKRAGTP